MKRDAILAYLYENTKFSSKCTMVHNASRKSTLSLIIIIYAKYCGTLIVHCTLS